MGKADLHIHTNHGDGLDTIEAILDYVEHHTDIDVIAITEHDNLAVSLQARDVWARGSYRFDFLTGVEVTTLQGHVVVLGIEEPVRSLRSVEETLIEAREQGGISFVPHPMSWLTRSIGPGTLDRLAANRGDGPWFDAMELASASPAARSYLAKARRLNRSSYRLPGVGASDAHFKEAIGSAYTTFSGSTAPDLIASIRAGAVEAHTGAYPRLRDVGVARTLALPIAGLRATPKALGWRRTAWSFVSRYFA